MYIHGTCDMGQPNAGTHEMAKPFEGQEGPDGPPWVSLMDPVGLLPVMQRFEGCCSFVFSDTSKHVSRHVGLASPHQPGV